jgi:blue copper oxidase
MMTLFLKKYAIAAALFAAIPFVSAQNPLAIPPLISGDTIALEIQAGTRQFFPPDNTPTYGINGTFLAPTILLHKGDTVMLAVTNHLTTSTTIHWHGLHVAPEHDGGPHQLIPVNAVWSPRFEVKNDAGTFWYHPHGANKTDLHVSKGIAGMMIVTDAAEAALPLPRTYGVDDFPVIVQTKAFDGLHQIAIATEYDTTLMVNGTMDPYLVAPAQVVRLRVLNGSSMRSYMFGFDGNRPFQMIASDGGLRDSALTLTRIRLSPGERAEILLDLSGLQGDTVTLRNFGAELPDGIYGAPRVGGGQAIIADYPFNPRNGGTYDVLPIHVGPPTANPITTLPTALVAATPLDSFGLDATRVFDLSPMMPNDSSTLAEGPFGINGKQFDMDSINVVTYLGNKERWHLVNTTLIAHPFHVHDVQFYVENVNGQPTPEFLQGKKDLVLVMPGEYVDVLTQFEDFADEMVPYMYHCHLLHHEDEGMMGSFLVLDTTPTARPAPIASPLGLSVYPNPASLVWNVRGETKQTVEHIALLDAMGREIERPQWRQGTDGFALSIANAHLTAGIYFLRIETWQASATVRLVKE